MNTSNFEFPLSVQEFQSFESGQKLKEAISALARSRQMEEQISYRIVCNRRGYLYAYCKKCTAQLRYRKEANERYQLCAWALRHRHEAIQARHAQLLEAIRSLPNEVKASSAMKILRKQTNVSTATFYRVYNSVKNQKFSVSSMFNCFGQIKVIGYYQPIPLGQPEDIPNVVIFSTPSMKQQFSKYGEFVSFDFTYGLIRNRGKRDFGVGFFVGLNNHLKITPFAMVITDEQSRQRMAKIFFQFFKLMGKAPGIIITDEQISFQSALKSLQYERLWDGYHLNDSFHILRNLRKNLRRKQNIKYFSSLIKAPNQIKFDELLIQSQQLLGPDTRALMRFLEKRERFCLSQIPESFVGLSVSTSISEKINDLLKSKIMMSKQYGVVLKIGYQLCEELIQKGKQAKISWQPIQKYYELQQLSELRHIYCEKVFEILMRNLSRTMHSYVRTQSNGSFFVKEGDGQFQIRQQLAEDGSSNIYCNCGYQKKTGIPCNHLLKIAVLTHRKIKPLINQRWEIDEINRMRPNNRVQKLFPPKKTRRRK